MPFGWVEPRKTLNKWTKYNMKFSRDQMKPWTFYFLVVLLTIFFHELGHCIVAWAHGIRAIPTPAKEYTIDRIPVRLKYFISAGGVAATLIASVTGIIVFSVNQTKSSSIFLAGVMASPFVYTILFIFKGRGHGDTEFQETQYALGLSYSGHFLDWALVLLCLVAVVLWYLVARPGYKSLPKILLGALLTFGFIVALQIANNALFDPIFGLKR
jgi:hypothetical protein